MEEALAFDKLAAKDFNLEPAAKNNAKKAQSDEYARKIERHVIAWLTVLIKDRLYVGPDIKQKEDILHMVKHLGVTHIINMKPHTDEVVEELKLNKAVCYARFFDAKTNVNPDIVRICVPNDMATMKEPKQIVFYAQAAKQIADLLSEKRSNVLYVHNRSGFDEEALAAILAWQRFDKQSFPENIVAWLNEHLYEGLLKSVEQKDLLQKALTQAKEQEKSGGIHNWVIVSKRQKK
ncbi:MAG: hypothetical protein K2Q45_03855 [Nitrosomonas sp.]|nr:hypothetical protein [Nitrosomonas sp.]